MPRRSSTINRADVRAAIKLMESLGKTVTAVKYHADGTFRVMTADHKSAPVDNPETAFDAWKGKHDARAP